LFYYLIFTRSIYPFLSLPSLLYIFYSPFLAMLTKGSFRSKLLCSMDRASYNMAIIIQQDATEYRLFKSVNCWTCFGWYFTHHQELITLYLEYPALMRPELLPVVNVVGRELPFSVMSSWWLVKYHPKHVEQLTDLIKLYSVASCWVIITISFKTVYKSTVIIFFISVYHIFSSIPLIFLLLFFLCRSFLRRANSKSAL